MEKIVSFFLSSFEDITFELKNKVSLVVVMSFVTALAFIVMGVITLFTGSTIPGVVEIIVGFTALGSLILLKRGTYNGAVMVLILILAAAFLGLTHLSAETGISLFYQYNSYAILIFIMALIISTNKMPIIVITIFKAVGFVSLYLLRILPESEQGITGYHIEVAVEIVLMLSVAAFFSIRGIGFINKALNLARAEAAENEKRAARVVNVLESSKESMTVGQDLKMCTDITSDAIKEIRQELVEINELVNNFKSKIINIIEENSEVLKETNKAQEVFHDQKAAIEETTAAITEMTASINMVSENVQRKKAGINSLVANADTGQRKMSDAMRSLTQVAGNIRNVIGIAKVISGISSQTKMLSMNAAIEAAHAGDYGRGFKVVAEEIRKLSEKAADQAKDIKARASANVAGIENSLEVNTDAGNQFLVIVDEVKQFTLAMEEITSSMAEMSLGAGQINEAISHLIELSSKTMSSIETVQESIETTNENVKAVDPFTRQLADILEEFSLRFDRIVNETEKIRDIGNTNIEVMGRINNQVASIHEEVGAGK